MTSHTIPFRGLLLRALLHAGVGEMRLLGTEFGARKYGVRHQANNGRDQLRDAYEEALDLVCYLRAAIYERDGE